MQTEKLEKRKILDYAMAIGGKKMYFGMRRALREAGVSQRPELNKRQIQNTLRKLVGSGEYTLDRMHLEKLIDEHEKRRHAFVQMGIEKDIEIEEETNPSPVVDYLLPKRKRRFDFKSPRVSPGNTSAPGLRSERATSIFQAIRKPLSSAIHSGAKGSMGPVTSISRLTRPKPK